MKLLVDMNLSPAWIPVLQAAGFDAIHWSALGSPDATDTILMMFARSHGYVILTHDLDFGTILAATQGAAPSVVQIRADNLSPASLGSTVIAALGQAQDALAAGALVTVDPGRSRITLLPING